MTPDIKSLGLGKSVLGAASLGLSDKLSQKPDKATEKKSSFDEALKQKMSDPVKGEKQIAKKPVLPKEAKLPKKEDEVVRDQIKPQDEKIESNKKVSAQALPKGEKNPLNKRLMVEELNNRSVQMPVDSSKKLDEVSDKPTDEISAVSEKPGKNVENLSQEQQVMLKFMDSIESEFGIPPEKIVEAMTKLPGKELLQTPEDTATDVIKNLDLDEKSAEKAQAMYLGMISQLSQFQPQQPIAPIDKQLEDSNKQIESATALLGAAALSIDQIIEKQQSAMNAYAAAHSGQLASAAPKANTDSQSIEKSIETDDQEMAATDEVETNILQKPDLQKSGADKDLAKNYKLSEYAHNQKAYAPPTDKVVESKDLSKPEQNVQTPQTDNSKNAPVIEKTAAAGAVAVAANASKQEGKEIVQKTSIEGNKILGAQTPQIKESFSKDSKSQSEHKSTRGDISDKLSVGDKTAGDFSLGHGQIQSTDKVKDLSLGAAAAGTGAVVTKNDEHPANIQQLMSQAQYLVKKGGGESVVKMTPEGLGQVHMRVSVSEGKVSLQMSTDTKEAKKTIEASLGDLKASLNAHKLSVDHIKVDVSHNFASSSESKGDGSSFQNKHDQNSSEAFKEQAKQFFGQSKEDKQNRPNTGKELGSLDLQKIQTMNAAGIAKSRYLGAGKGSGLDLVA